MQLTSHHQDKTLIHIFSPLEFIVANFMTSFHRQSTSKTSTSIRKVAHQGSNSAEVSPYPEGNLRNGDHCFLRGEE